MMNNLIKNALANLRLGFEKSKPKVHEFVIKTNDIFKRHTGIDMLDTYQERVNTLGAQLSEAQFQRSSIMNELKRVREDHQKLQDELHSMKFRQDMNRFMELMRVDVQMVKDEKAVTMKLEEQDKLEREIFTAFLDAIRQAYEKHQIRLEKTRFYSLAVSFVVSFISLIIAIIRETDTVSQDVITQCANIAGKLDELNAVPTQCKDIVGKLENLDDVQMQCSNIERKLDNLDSTFSTSSVLKSLKNLNVASVTTAYKEDSLAWKWPFGLGVATTVFLVMLFRF